MNTILIQAVVLIFFVGLFALLKPLAESFWFFWRRQKFALAQPYVLLELNIPREILKSPKAMEQVLNTIATLRNTPPSAKAKYIDGEVPRSFALEVVSFEGAVHFYMRVPVVARTVVEAALFSYYPDVEVTEVPDYITKLPENISDAENRSLLVFGGEIVLAREAAYPIRSYTEFESPDEDKQYDPIGILLEVMGKVKAGETLGLQFVITPRDGKWADEWKDLLKNLREKKETKPQSYALKVDFPEGGPLPAFVLPEEKKEETPKQAQRTPGEVLVIESVERNLSKPAFDVVTRVLYIGQKGASNENALNAGLTGALNQYQSSVLNSFKGNQAMYTRASQWVKPYVFPETRLWYKRERILLNYRIRETPMDTFAGKLITSFFYNWNTHSQASVLNVESLATLFHPPTKLVLTAPHIARVESRKSGAPSGLAVYGDEADIQKFL